MSSAKPPGIAALLSGASCEHVAADGRKRRAVHGPARFVPLYAAELLLSGARDRRAALREIEEAIEERDRVQRERGRAAGASEVVAAMHSTHGRPEA